MTSKVPLLSKIQKLFCNLKWEHSLKITLKSYCSKRVAPISMAFSLHEPKNQDTPPPIILMHGLFGSKNNWRSLSKQIANQTGRRIYAVDARNHGDSPRISQMNYMCMSSDILHFIQERDLKKVCLMGHSMGGRAVMATALQNPDFIEKLFVFDVGPVNHSDVSNRLPDFVTIMRDINLPKHLKLPEARKLVDEELKKTVKDQGLRQFLLTNLAKEDNFYWKANLDVIIECHSQFYHFPITSKSFSGETHFIAGAQSKYIRVIDEDPIREFFPKATFDYIEDAGHWLHADQPKRFLETLIPLINSTPS